MSARKFNGIITRLRNRCHKFGVSNIYITKIADEQFIINGKDWKDSIDIDLNTVNLIIQTGYIQLENNINSIKVNSKELVIVNKHILNKGYKNHGVSNILHITSLIGGSFALILSFIFYKLDTQTVGTINYSLTGNHNGFNVLSWFDMLLIGLFLFFATFAFKYIDKNEK